MKTILILLTLSISSFAGDFVMMTRTGSENIDYTYGRCYYESYSGMQAQIVVKGGMYACPYTIWYNPITNLWRR